MQQSRAAVWAPRGSWENIGHVEKTNDRDYEVEERYGFWIPRIEQSFCRLGKESLLKYFISQQAVPHHGVGSK